MNPDSATTNLEPAEAFDATVGDIARLSGVQGPTVRTYCALGLLPFIRLANGTRLLQRSAAQKVRELKEERLSRCGRYRREAN
jgi:DNA-binding transcriptional MerR regulator